MRHVSTGGEGSSEKPMNMTQEKELALNTCQAQEAKRKQTMVLATEHSPAPPSPVIKERMY